MLLYCVTAVFLVALLTYNRRRHIAVWWWAMKIDLYVRKHQLSPPSSPWCAVPLSTQDLLTPKSLTNCSILGFFSVPSFLIGGLFFFEWYVPIALIAVVYISHSIIYGLLGPPSKKQYWRLKRRLETLQNMADRLMQLEDADAHGYLLQLLEEVKDTPMSELVPDYKAGQDEPLKSDEIKKSVPEIEKTNRDAALRYAEWYRQRPDSGQTG